MGWHGLPLAHVVLGHLGRVNPSYFLFYHQYFLNAERPKSLLEVSKVGKRRLNTSINATTYR